MKTIINITRTELRTFFYSPIAWLVLVIFAFQCGLTLTDQLSDTIADSHAGMMLFDLTGRLLSYFNGYFNSVQKTAYLYLPLLTMGLISRELSSGSIKLVFSSPVTTTELILGKYLSMLIYCGLMTLIAATATIPAILSVQHFDFGLALSGLLSTFLLIAAYAAIGLFMSCLTEYQVVAAVSTMVLLGALNYVGEIGKGTDVIREITGFLSIAGRAESLRDGMLISTDLVYFFMIIVFFLLVSIFYLGSKQKTTTVLTKTSRFASVLAGLTLLGYLASIPWMVFYRDFTATQQRTIPLSTQQALQRIDGPIKVTTYVNLLDEEFWPYVSPQNRKADRDFWLPYVRFRPDIQFAYVYFYGKAELPFVYQNNPNLNERQIAEKKAEAYGLNMQHVVPAEKLADRGLLETEGNRTVRILEAGGRKIPLRFFAGEINANPNYQDITDALQLVKERPVQVTFLEGEGERGFTKAGDREYRMMLAQSKFRQSLINHGFEFVSASGASGIDPATDILVIAAPRVPIPPQKQAHISAYLSSGGNALIMAEPGSTKFLEPIARPLGLSFKPGLLVQQSKDFPADLAKLRIRPEARSLDHPDLESAIGNAVTSTGVTGLEHQTPAPYKLTPILSNDSSSNWMRSSGILPDTGAVSFQPKLGDQKGTIVTAYALDSPLSGKQQQKILVFGDADWLSMSELYRQTGVHYNFALTYAVFKWLGNSRFPRKISKTPPPDVEISGDKNSVFRFRVLFLCILPGLLLIAGTTLLFRRLVK